MSSCLSTDNVLVAFETMHHLNQKRSGKIREMVLKLDMSKTFDRVEWGCLRDIMQKMGFDSKWITFMMQCVISVIYSIRLNGKPHGYITPTRGLTQGDPISLFLFLFCADGLSSLLQQAISAGTLRGLAANPQGPRISHLFFANNSIIFCQATREECNRLEQILETYEQASSQKSIVRRPLYFSVETPHKISRKR